MIERQLSEYITLKFETDRNHSEWFGYYNYDPLSSNHAMLLCHRVSVDAVAPEKGMNVDIGFYDIQSAKWNRIGTSDSWNWPQAAMAQWIPNQEKENKVIFNLSKDGHLISRIHNLETGEIQDLGWSIYGITPDGKKSIALDLERSYWCRAYHYQSVANELLNVPIPQGDGIFEIDLEQNTRKRIVDIRDIIKLDADEDFPKLKHWFEHVMISPSGTRFSFLHRFSPIDNALQYQTRLCIANIDGTDIQVIPGWRDFSFSHFGWQSDSSFVIYSVRIPKLQKSFLKSIKNDNNPSSVSIGNLKTRIVIGIKNIIPRAIRSRLKGGASASFYQYYALKDDRYVPTEVFNQPVFNIDGHPSFTKDGRYMITDTYADNNSYRHLIVFDTVTKKFLELGKFYEPLVGNPARCDLHPKLSRDNEFVAVDTTHTGKHQTLLFKLEWEKIQRVISL